MVLTVNYLLKDQFKIGKFKNNSNPIDQNLDDFDFVKNAAILVLGDFKHIPYNECKHKLEGQMTNPTIKCLKALILTAIKKHVENLVVSKFNKVPLYDIFSSFEHKLSRLDLLFKPLFLKTEVFSIFSPSKNRFLEIGFSYLGSAILSNDLALMSVINTTNSYISMARKKSQTNGHQILKLHSRFLSLCGLLKCTRFKESILQASLTEQSVISDCFKSEFKQLEEDNPMDVAVDRYLQSVLQAVALEKRIQILLNKVFSENYIENAMKTLQSKEIIEKAIQNTSQKAADSLENLRKLYRFGYEADRGETFCLKFEDFILKRVNRVFVERREGLSDMAGLIELLKVVEIVKMCCEEADKVKAFSDKAFSIALANRQTDCVQKLAEFIDQKIKNASDVNFQEELSSIKLVISVIHQKKHFEKVHRTFMARRLLLASLHSIPKNQIVRENLVVDILSKQCGKEYISKMSGMLYDLSVSPVKSSEGSFFLNVLNSNFWPARRELSITLPHNVNKIIRELCTKQASLFTNKKVGWCPSFDSATVVLSVNEKTAEMELNGFQVCFLLLFNEYDTISFNRALELTGIDEPILRLVIETLESKSNPLILRKSGDVDLFSLNEQFEFEAVYKIKKCIFDLDVENFVVIEDRRVGTEAHYRIDSKIVKLLKKHKFLSFEDLLERLKLLGVEEKVEYIESRVQSLIEAEYLKRNENDRRVLDYVP